MLEVAILGAGEIGGAVAHVLARRDIARTIRLIDERAQVAAGKGLDIMQAAPVEGFSTRITASDDVFTAAAAAIIIVADDVGAGESNGERGLLLLKQIARMGTGPIVLCAGATHRELIDRGVREAGFAASALFGSAPEALAGALRAIVALETDGSANDVALTVLGVPPSQTVVPWEEMTIGGLSANRVLDEPARRRIAAKVAPLWPPGPHALATAAAEAVSCVAGQSRRVLACFVAPDRESLHRTRAAALPVRLGRDGVVKIELPALSANARVALDNAMMT